MHSTTHDVKVPFCILGFSISRKINHCFHVDNDKYELGIGYDTIIGRDLMVQIGLTADFKHKVIQWYDATVHMKETRILTGKYYLSKREMREVVMKTS